jgi:small nuclear ribonucleoprotein (snRNP)-like protein
VRGTLKSVDQYLNIKLDDISVVEELKYPHLVSRDRFGARKEMGRWCVERSCCMRGNDETLALVHGTDC